jgi:hypothetical protein
MGREWGYRQSANCGEEAAVFCLPAYSVPVTGLEAMIEGR